MWRRLPADAREKTYGQDAHATNLCLSMTGVVAFGAFGQQAFSAALAAASQGGPATFGSHAGPESVLPFAGAFRGLIGTFHNGQKSECLP